MSKVSMVSRTIEIECEDFDNYILEYALSKSPVAKALYLAAETIIKFYTSISKAEIFDVPPFKPGGIVGGNLSINERGGEIINLPDGSTVIPKEISDNIVKGKITIGTNLPRIELPENSGFISSSLNKPVNTKLTTKQFKKTIKKTIKKIKKDLK